MACRNNEVHFFEWNVVRKRDEILAIIAWDNLIWAMVGNILSHPQTLTRVILLVPCQHQLRHKKSSNISQTRFELEWGG